MGLKSALFNFKEELRYRVLNEEAEMEIKNATNEHYEYDFTIKIEGKRICHFAVAKDFICYHDDFAIGTFDRADIPQLLTIGKNRFPSMTEEERRRIKELHEEIKKIEERCKNPF